LLVSNFLNQYLILKFTATIIFKFNEKSIFITYVYAKFLQMKADEGMWLMMLVKRLNGTDLQKQGLHLTPEEIYSVNHSSLKDGIVQFGGGCTAEVVSKEGLVFTNHHCGYDAIASLSTPEKII
jgi:hypothetical protein